MRYAHNAGSSREDESVGVGLPVSDEGQQCGVAGADHVDALTAVALEQPDGQFVRAATDDPPDTACQLPALQDVYRIVGHKGDCGRYPESRRENPVFPGDCFSAPMSARPVVG